MPARLEELTPGAVVRGVAHDRPVRIAGVEWIGDGAISLTYTPEGSTRPETTLVYRWQEPSLELADAGSAWVYDADGALFRLVLEALRIHNAYLFDPALALSASAVEPLPHQITAVYETMLQRQPLRYLLADDPGAGKTIMTGLLIKELVLRSSLERCLIVCPGQLAEQWQDELEQKFGLRFGIVGRGDVEESATGNPWDERPYSIVRLDYAKREAVRARLEAADDWDLVVVDEAHKCSASFSGGEVKETERYQLVQTLSQKTRDLLLLTATPHRGKEEDFQLFLRLLDGDRFEGRFRTGAHHVDVSDIMHRVTKEELLDFDGHRLFPERRAYTVAYALSELESRLYESVTHYVSAEMNRADALGVEGGEAKRRGTVVGFALTMLQRRLASSPEAILRSLERRRKRLSETLGEWKLRHNVASLSDDSTLTRGRARDADELEDELEDEGEQEIEQIVDQATTARTVAELDREVDVLDRLVVLAKQVRQHEHDSKWVALRGLLERGEQMFDPRGRRRKLIIFTEHRDTLEYLVDRIGTYLSSHERVVRIHGGLGREERRAEQERFLNDEDAIVLVATDAAGEGVNLQRAHLMVNYDLPWNPNRLEQRFGRIHRFGQREVCHVWNLVAHETREGAVYQRLLEKLASEAEALGGRVFDVLGELFQDRPLRELLMDAIRYGDDPEVKRRLEERIEGAVDRDSLEKLLRERALNAQQFGMEQVLRARGLLQRAEIMRLVPRSIAAFFLEAFRTIGGTIYEREPQRYQISHVPAELRRRDPGRAAGPPVLRRYERICFERRLMYMDGKPGPAELLTPGHPLLEGVIDLLIERFGSVLRRGAVLVDRRQEAEAAGPRALVCLQQDIVDGTLNRAGDRRLASREFHFVELDAQGIAHNAGSAPHLDYDAPNEAEQPALPALRGGALARRDPEAEARLFAVSHLVEPHLRRVLDFRNEQVVKVRDAVYERLTGEIVHQDGRAAWLRDQELAGRQPRMNPDRAEAQAEELRVRLNRRMDELDRECLLSPQPPIVRAAALVVPPSTLLPAAAAPTADPAARRLIELLAMDAVMAAEIAAGRVPKDVHEHDRGFDIESWDPGCGRSRLIEVKGRQADQETVSLTRNELLVAMNTRDDYYLAIALVRDGAVESVRFVQDPTAGQRAIGPLFGVTAVTFDIDKLLEGAAVPVPGD